MTGPWKLPELWTRQRTRAHNSLDAGTTDAGAHSYHSPLRLDQPYAAARAILSTTCLGPSPPWWPVLTRPRVAGFQVSPEVRDSRACSATRSGARRVQPSCNPEPL